MGKMRWALVCFLVSFLVNGALAKDSFLSIYKITDHVPSASYLKMTEQEPTWPALTYPADFYRATWALSQDNVPLSMADRTALMDLQQSAEDVWNSILECAGKDPALARAHYSEGKYCQDEKRNGEVRADLFKLYSSIGAFLMTSSINGDEGENYFKMDWHSHSLRTAPLMVQILYEYIAISGFYEDTFFFGEGGPDASALKKLERKGKWENDMLADVRSRMKLHDSAARLILILTQKCEDQGLWPSLVQPLLGFRDDSYGMSAVVFRGQKVEWSKYAAWVSTHVMMACGEYQIKENLGFYEQIKERVDEANKHPFDSVYFFRHLALRQLRVYETAR